MNNHQFLDNTLLGARFSPCRLWRYTLWRRWEYSPPERLVAFVGLNPSTADETANDPTVRRCIQFAKDWGFSGMVMLNAFAYRATDPQDMKRQADPVGPWNDAALMEITGAVGRVVCCWGTHGAFRGRHGDVLNLLKNRRRFHLGLTKDAFPRHPLYLASATQPTLWTSPTYKPPADHQWRRNITTIPDAIPETSDLV